MCRRGHVYECGAAQYHRLPVAIWIDRVKENRIFCVKIDTNQHAGNEALNVHTKQLKMIMRERGRQQKNISYRSMRARKETRKNCWIDGCKTWTLNGWAENAMRLWLWRWSILAKRFGVCVCVSQWMEAIVMHCGFRVVWENNRQQNHRPNGRTSE